MTRLDVAREAIGQETADRPKADSPVAGRGMPGARVPGARVPDSGALSTGIRGTGSVARRIAGVDEAGRGPLAGPVVAAAVILRPGRPIVGVADSKTLTAAERERLEVVIRRRAVCFGVGWADPAEIDSLNILHATFLAMRRAVLSMTCRPDLLLVDGNRLPRLTGLGAPVQARAIVGGDASQAAIGAASILAKTARDRYMCGMHERYPHYEFATHKGYATPLHRRLLAEHGPCPLHRRSFAPVYASLEGETWEPEIDWEDGLPEAAVSLQSVSVAMDPS